MASVGLVNAYTPKVEDRNNNECVKLRFYFGVFFDGTGNNMVPASVAKDKRKNVKKDVELYVDESLIKGANTIEDKPLDEKIAKKLDNGETYGHLVGSGRSNVAILHSCYQGLSGTQANGIKADVVKVYNIYIQGAGKEDVNLDNKIQDVKNLLGCGFAYGKTGVVSLVSMAVRAVRLILDGFSIKHLENSEVFFDVFGFSRGAACARLFAYVVGRGGNDKLGCEKYFQEFQAKTYFKEEYLHFLDKYGEFPVLKHQVKFLGIFDTVSSIGITYDDNVKDFGLDSPDKDWVDRTFHICAMDEFRSRFALTNIGINKEGNVEAFLPGCHSDIGGGYQKGAETFILNSVGLISKYQIFVDESENVIEKQRPVTADISVNTMEVLGWGKGCEIENHYIRGFVAVSRSNVFAGYSNIPLALMRDAANQKNTEKRLMFVELPVGRFAIPEELGYMKSECSMELEKMLCGRYWYLPGKKYCSDKYRALRHQYLHFSATDEILTSKTSIIHSPNITNGVVCRIIYHGNSGASPIPEYINPAQKKFLSKKAFRK